MAKTLNSNGKNNLPFDDEELLKRYKKAKKQLQKMQYDYDVAKRKNDMKEMSNVSFYLSHCIELNIALEEEMKYRNLS